MPDRIALVVDDNSEFRERLTVVLSRLGLRVQVASGEEETLDLLKRLGPEVVFIGVDLPEKKGYALFSKVKNVRRRVAVVLATSTVSRADLKLHEKLKVHADAYLQRSLSDDELFDTVENQIGLTHAPVESSEKAPQPPPEPNGPTATSDVENDTKPEEPAEASPAKVSVEPWLAAMLDPETVAILADIDEESSILPASASRPAGEVSPAAVAELETEVARLQEEVEQTRRDAQSSPFSGDFLALREETSRKNKEIRELTEALSRRHEQVAVVKSRLTDFARKLLDAEKGYERSRELAADTRAELDSVRTKLSHVRLELEEQEKKHDQETKELQQRLSETESRHAELRRDLDAELSTSRATHAKTIQTKEAEHAWALEALATKLREQKSRLVDELKSKYTDKLKELQASHAQHAQQSKQAHEKELEAAHASHQEAATRAAIEAQEAMRQAAEKSAALLEQSNRQRIADLARAEQKRDADLIAAAKQRREELETQARKHRAEQEGLTRDLAATRARIERISTEFGAKIQDTVKSLDEERQRHQETREHYERELQNAQSAHTKTLEQAEQDQFSALTGLSRKFREDRTRILELEKKRWEEKVEKLTAAQEESVSALEKQYQDEIAQLNAAQNAFQKHNEEVTAQAVELAVDNARAEVQKELESTRRTQADEVAALRQEHEKEVSSLQAAHMEALQKRDRENQQALRDAVEAARADWNEKLDRSHGESTEALAAQRREYEEEISTLEQAHKEGILKREHEARDQLRLVEEERDKARDAGDDLRAQMAEAEAKQRSSLAVIDERHKVELKELQKELKSRILRTEEEKQFLAASVEKLKRQSATELTRALDALAHEKKLHQASQDRYERRLTELNARHSEGIKEIEQDWMAKFEVLDKSLTERSEKAVSALGQEMKSRLEKERFSHEEATGALAKDFEMELAATRQQLERTRDLEENYQSGSRELTAMKGRVEELTKSLEAAGEEIAVRDEQLQEHNRRQAETTKTIDSLKAVIDDFSRSVEGCMRDREESDQTISSLKAVIDDFYRSLDRSKQSERKN